jgi:pilus assembly protein CpaC
VVRARNGGHAPDHAAAALNGFPGLMDLPVLGTLFRTRDFMDEKTELVILVAPMSAYPAGRASK